MKLLLIQQKMIGDVLVSSVLCEYLKTKGENFEVHYLVNENAVPVVAENPFIDQLIVFKKEHRENKLKFYSFLRVIAKKNYDVVIDIHGKLESNLISLFSGAKMKIAFSKSRSKFMYTHPIPIKSRQVPGVYTTLDDRLALLEPLLGTVENDLSPKIYLSPKEISEAKVFLQRSEIALNKPIIMIGVLGSETSKTYPLAYLAQVIDTIAQKTEAILLFNYMPSQKEDAKKLFSLCLPSTKDQIAFEIFAPSLRKFLGILHHCDALIGNEGGTTNMAKALGKPTFAIFAPWIDKKGWHTFANDANIAIHVADYFKDEFRRLDKKELKKRTEALYLKLKPALFEEKLISFLENKILSDQ